MDYVALLRGWPLMRVFTGLIALVVALVATVAGLLAFGAHAPPALGAALLTVGALALIVVIISLARPRTTRVIALPPSIPVADGAPATPAPDGPATITAAPPAPVAPPSIPAPAVAMPAMPAVIAPPAPAFLPAPGPLFVGREQELETLVAGLRRAHGATALALVGPAGGGKHSVITQAIEAHRAVGTFPAGSWWLPAADLHGDRGLRRVLIGVLEHLGGPMVAMTATLRMGEAAVADLVRGKRMLFWLDDVAADFPIGRALTALTARDANGVGPVLVIASQSDWAMPEINEIMLEVPALDEAFDLFREWLELAGRPLEFEEYDAAKAICVNLSNLPLALRLAAGYAAQSGARLAKLAADLGSAVYPPGDLERTANQTVAFVEASLFPQPRRAFASLAVFDAPQIDLAQAAAVAATVAGGTAEGARADLEAMVRLGLLEPDGDDAHPLVRLHPLVRRYAADRLRELGPDAEGQARAALASLLHARRKADAQDDDRAWDLPGLAPRA
jgi:hypothetical protein